MSEMLIKRKNTASLYHYTCQSFGNDDVYCTPVIGAVIVTRWLVASFYKQIDYVKYPV